MIQQTAEILYKPCTESVLYVDKYPDKYITDIEYEVINRQPGTVIPIVRDIARDVIGLSLSGLGFVLKFTFMAVYSIVHALFIGVHKFSRQTDKRTRQKSVQKNNIVVNVYVNVN